MKRENVLDTLKKINQNSYGSATAYAAAFRSLCLQLGNDKLPEFVKIDFFISGLRLKTQEKTRGEIATFDEEKKTLKNIIAIACSYDQTYNYNQRQTRNYGAGNTNIRANQGYN